MVSHHGSLYTISREDVYDYLRCPKIVSIKAFRRRYQHEVCKAIAKPPLLAEPHIIGKIGEVSAEQVLTHPELASGTLEARARIRLAQLGVVLNRELENLLREALSGLQSLKAYVEESYGSLKIIGKGETRYSTAPCYGMPDFVAISEKQKGPILIEVKNTKSKSKTDVFQARFYNTLKSTVGVALLKERLEKSERVLAPRVIFARNSETLIVYPRLEECVKVTDTLDMNVNFVKSIWKAKQLGLRGRWPHTDCGKMCPHKRLKVELRDDDIEVLKPLPLILAKGMEENRVELDYLFLRSYCMSRIPGLFLLGPKFPDEVKKFIVANFGIDNLEAKKILDGEIKRLSPQRLAKLMSPEVEGWQKLLREELSLDAAAGVSSRIYSLPRESSSNIRKSWDRWR